jgi:hypothetical protein
VLSAVATAPGSVLFVFDFLDSIKIKNDIMLGLVADKFEQSGRDGLQAIGCSDRIQGTLYSAHAIISVFPYFEVKEILDRTMGQPNPLGCAECGRYRSRFCTFCL